MADLRSLNQQIWKCKKCERCPHPSMPGYFPKEFDVLVIGQNPGQLHKRENGWDDADYAFNDSDWSEFQQDYAKGLLYSPMGEWVKEGFQGKIRWSLTNIVKCRVPDNSPRLDEIQKCRPWLEAQLKVLKPKVIITLGAQSWSWWDFLISIDRAEGKLFYAERPYYTGLIMPIYHPVYRRNAHDKFTRAYFQNIISILKSNKLMSTALKTAKLNSIGV